MPRYSDILIDYFESPRNVGRLDAPDAVGRASLNGRAPRMTLYLRIKDSVVEQASCETAGCGVAIACSSILTERITGRSLKDCLMVSPAELEQGLGGLPIEKRFCAALAVRALFDALEQVSDGVMGRGSADGQGTGEEERGQD